MTWSFTKRIKVIPAVHLNVSENGISTSIGFKGSSAIIGNSETYLNTSNQDLELSTKQKIVSESKEFQPKLNNFEYLMKLPKDIFSADMGEVTSQDLQGIKQVILNVRSERRILEYEIRKVEAELSKSETKLRKSYILLYGLINQKIAKNIKEDIKKQQEVLEGLKGCLENCIVNIDIDFDEKIKEKYELLVSTFKQVAKSNRKWNIIRARKKDGFRSVRSSIIQKEIGFLYIKNLTGIKTEYPALYFENIDGKDFYFYPTFIVVFEQRIIKFKLIGYSDFKFYFDGTRFVEEGKVPSDGVVVDRTQYKTRELRLKGHKIRINSSEVIYDQLPIVRYGAISIETETGLNVEYAFSNYNAAEAFYQALLEYQKTMENIKFL